MVLTRSQAKKQRSPSPDQSPSNKTDKQPKKKGTAAQPLAASKLHINLPNAGMGQQGSKPAQASDFPLSHPIAISVPPSPAGLLEDQNLDLVPQLCRSPVRAPVGEKLLPKPSERPAVPSNKLPDGPEPVQIDVEYAPRDQLQPLDDPAAALESCIAGLEAADWVEAVKALNMLRQLAAHHPTICQPQLEQLIGGVLKSVRSLRSSLCKTAIMTVTDLYISFGDTLLPLTDLGGPAKPVNSMLAQILLKCSSNDKKFVIEEAQRALQTMAESTVPSEILTLLIRYLDHKNPKVRGKTGGAVAAAVIHMQPLDMTSFGMVKLLQLSGKLITDNTPDAREAAKRLVGLLRTAFADAAVQQQLDVQVPEPEPAVEGEPPASIPSKWEYFCRQNLNASAALAVLKVVEC